MGHTYENPDGVVQATSGCHRRVRRHPCLGPIQLSAAQQPGPAVQTGAQPPPLHWLRTVAAVGCAHRALSGRARCADSCGFHLSNADCRSGEISPAESQSDRRSAGAEVDKQDWDPSVKALTQFPSVLADMDKNLSWTSELGDTNYNQQADIMTAIQFMRAKAQGAGNLNTTPQQSVTNQDNTVSIQPENPDVVDAPDYDPELVYGYPVGLWPGFYPWWGAENPYLSFGVGFGIGPFFGYGWGWHGWDLDWRNRGLMYGGGGTCPAAERFIPQRIYAGRLPRAGILRSWRQWPARLWWCGVAWKHRRTLRCLWRGQPWWRCTRQFRARRVQCAVGRSAARVAAGAEHVVEAVVVPTAAATGSGGGFILNS